MNQIEQITLRREQRSEEVKAALKKVEQLKKIKKEKKK